MHGKPGHGQPGGAERFAEGVQQTGSLWEAEQPARSVVVRQAVRPVGGTGVPIGLVPVVGVGDALVAVGRPGVGNDFAADIQNNQPIASGATNASVNITNSASNCGGASSGSTE